MLVQYRSSHLEPFKTDYASDISEGGILLSEATPPLDPGTTLYMQFVTRDGMHLVSVEASVVRRAADGGQGMRFVKLESADLAVLQELVTKETARQGKTS